MDLRPQRDQDIPNIFNAPKHLDYFDICAGENRGYGQNNLDLKNAVTFRTQRGTDPRQG